MDTAPLWDGTVFLRELLRVVPEVLPVVQEHLADQDMLLLHLFLPELLALSVGWFPGRPEALGRLLLVVEEAFRRGDSALVEAVAVSFVEHAGAHPGESPDFLASWPPALRGEWERSRSA